MYAEAIISIVSLANRLQFSLEKQYFSINLAMQMIINLHSLMISVVFMTLLLSDTFFILQPPEEQIFRGTFKVIEGDIFLPELADPSNNKFKIRSRDYRERLNLLFRRSGIRNGFVGTEVLALDG